MKLNTKKTIGVGRSMFFTIRIVTTMFFRDLDYYLIQGGTAAARRQNLIQKFNDENNKRGRLFICTGMFLAQS